MLLLMHCWRHMLLYHLRVGLLMLLLLLYRHLLIGALGLGREDCIGRGTHRELILRVCKALLEADEEWDQEEAEHLADEAWRCDTCGTDILTRHGLFDALFEFFSLEPELPLPGELVPELV